MARRTAAAVVALACSALVVTAMPAGTRGQSPTAARPSPSAGPVDPSAGFTWFEVRSRRDGGSDLSVGRFDGRSWRVARSDGGIVATGPFDGQVIAAVERPTGTVFLRIDAASGARVRLSRTEDRVDSVALDVVSGRYLWTTRDGSIRDPHDEASLWSAPLAGGEPVLVAGPTEAYVSYVQDVPEGGRVVWWGAGSGSGGQFAIVVDLVAGTQTAVDDANGQVVGLVGQRLIWIGGTCSELCYPLRGWEPTEAEPVDILPGPGSYAALGSDAAGRSVLLGISVDDARVMTYLAIDPSGTIQPLDVDPAAGMNAARQSPWTGWETPGFLPLTPGVGFLDRRGDPVVDRAVLVPIPGSEPVEIEPSAAPS